MNKFQALDRTNKAISTLLVLLVVISLVFAVVSLLIINLQPATTFKLHNFPETAICSDENGNVSMNFEQPTKVLGIGPDVYVGYLTQHNNKMRFISRVLIAEGFGYNNHDEFAIDVLNSDTDELKLQLTSGSDSRTLTCRTR